MLETISIRQLFDNRIVLRDLEPTRPEMPGLQAVRGRLGVPENMIPRKNEPDYAKVVEALVEHVSAGKARSIFYVGDTIFNDGTAIRNVASRGTYDILGFICSQVREGQLGEFILGNIILGDDWSHLWKLLKEGLKQGFSIGPELVAIFDLDHTVYGAKGRAGEPLRQARLAAVSNLLRDALGDERYDQDQVQRYYREFDRDEFHPFTRDNQDYVVFLTLVCCLGLTDVEGVRKELSEPGKSMISFIEMMRAKAERRKLKENLEKVWEIMQEVYFNSRFGDQTPCKAFREQEYLTTSQFMTIETSNEDPEDISQRKIVITREIVEFVQFLSQYEVRALALSDRPGEATEPQRYGGVSEGSILDIRMPIWGYSIIDELSTIMRCC